MKNLAYLLISFGAIMDILSVWTLVKALPGSAERILSIANIVIGSIMIIVGAVYTSKHKSN